MAMTTTWSLSHEIDKTRVCTSVSDNLVVVSKHPVATSRVSSSFIIVLPSHTEKEIV